MLGRYEIRDDASLGYSVVVADEKLEGPRPPRQIRLLYRGPVQLARTKNLATMAEVIFAELETILYGERDDAIYLDLACLFTEGAGGLIPSAYLPYPAKQGRRVDEAGIRLPVSKTVAVDPRSGRLIPTRPHVQIPVQSRGSRRFSAGAAGPIG
ncbi:MAG TPA: hypothetical protein VEQ37_11495 [Actinomycetota bacterium]|nr:hypothetical protein [Actinomycetota bacterium]